MLLFWQEFFHFSAAMLAILVSVSVASLFLITYRFERQLQTVWRSIGFTAFAVAFFLFILERKFPGIALLAIFFDVLGFLAIYKGVLAEPKLQHLRAAGGRGAGTQIQKVADLKADWKAIKKFFSLKTLKKLWKWYLDIRNVSELAAYLILGALAVLLLFLLAPSIFALIFLNIYTFSILEAIAVVFIALTIRLQIRRYQGEKDPKARRNNLYPLVAFVFLLARGISLVLWRLPDINIVFLRKLKLDFSLTWQLSILFTFVGFFFLALWAWQFIRVRVLLRTYVVFLAIAVTVATFSALIFSLLIFQIVEDNNLQLMSQGAETQNLIMQDRADTATFVARLLASDERFGAAFRLRSARNLSDTAERFFDISGVDIIRIYDASGTVLISPNDTRDEGRVFDEDKFLQSVLERNKPIKTFDVRPGILSPVLITRTIYPISQGNRATGAVEVGYQFDNAFIDFSKEATGLDVTMYVDNLRAATTIRTLDNISRWVGSREVDGAALDEVLAKGNSYAGVVDRLGIIYYSAFKPVTDADGEIIGMVSVGTPTEILFEDARQQLLSTFLISIAISLLAALFGWFAIKNFRKIS